MIYFPVVILIISISVQKQQKKDHSDKVKLEIQGVTYQIQGLKIGGGVTLQTGKLLHVDKVSILSNTLSLNNGLSTFNELNSIYDLINKKIKHWWVVFILQTLITKTMLHVFLFVFTRI